MKALFAYFDSESNEHSHNLMTFDKLVFKFGEEAVQHASCRKAFEDAGIELIPAIIIYGHPHGPVTYDTFEFARPRMMAEAKSHVREIDGIFLFLHGASKVIGLVGGSAEHAFLKETREITRPYMPTALVMDPHGNPSEGLVSRVNILRCYRHFPRTDAEETFQFVVEEFVKLLKNRRNIRPVYREVPIIISGEESVSLDESVVSINRLCGEAEKNEHITSAFSHTGYLCHDGDKLECSVVVVPQSGKYRAYTDEVTDHIRAFVYSRRHEFHYHGNTGEPQEVLKKTIAHTGGTVFIIDSGDSVGSGGDGFSTYMLRQILALHDTNRKQYLISGIVDHNASKKLYPRHVGKHVSLCIGMNYNELCKSVPVEGTMIAKGISDEGYEHKRDIGTAITVQLDHAPVSVVILNDAIQFYEPKQYIRCGVVLKEYDVVVVRQGYISAEFAAHGDLCMMALTQRPTYQRNELLEFKQVYHPMQPYDDYDLKDMP